MDTESFFNISLRYLFVNTLFIKNYSNSSGRFPTAPSNRNRALFQHLKCTLIRTKIVQTS